MRGDMWDGVALDRRRRIVRAVRHGETVREPDDAALAIQYANALRRPRRPLQWRLPAPSARVSGLATLLFWLVVHLVAAQSWHRPVDVAVSLSLFALAAADAALRLRLIRRVDRSVRANAALLHELGRAVPQEPGPLPWNPQAAGSVTIAPAATLILLVGIVVLTGDEPPHPPHWQLLLFAVAGFTGAAIALVSARLGFVGWQRAEAGATGRRPAPLGVIVGAGLTAFWILQTAVVLVWNW